MSALALARARRLLRRPLLWLGAGLVAVITALALGRGGLLGLPQAPPGVTAHQAGLAGLEALRERAMALEAAAAAGSTLPPDAALAAAAEGLAMVRSGDPERGLARMREAFAAAPQDLVVGNAYRMAAMSLKRRFIADPTRGATETERLPQWLTREPLAATERLGREHPSREIVLQQALAWADEIVLFHALEIQAPANVESVKLLTQLLEREPSYVPALYGRGLGYLHRPARLVWPEARRAAPDAASRDLGLAVAIGRRVGGGSAGLRGTLALALGDAYAKEGQADRARSWWQIAENTSSDIALRAQVRRRFAWRDDELLERLEAELEASLLDRQDPLTDLAVMWR